MRNDLLVSLVVASAYVVFLHFASLFDVDDIDVDNVVIFIRLPGQYKLSRNAMLW